MPSTIFILFRQADNLILFFCVYLCFLLSRKGALNIKASKTALKAAKILSNLKGENIALLDVSEISNITDFYLIVSGTSSPHLRAMFDEVQREFKKDGILCYRKTGDSECGWLILDYVDMVIHIFSENARSYYAIEELWETAPRLDLHIQ